MVTNLNKETLVLTSKDGKKYEVPTTNHVINHVQAIITSDRPSKSIHNVYKFPSIEPVIRYLHAAASFPTKETWLKAIRRGNDFTWLLVTVKKVTNHYLKSKETHQGHMKGQRQGVRSTSRADPPTVEHKDLDITKKENLHDIIITTYEMK